MVFVTGRRGLAFWERAHRIQEVVRKSWEGLQGVVIGPLWRFEDPATQTHANRRGREKDGAGYRGFSGDLWDVFSGSPGLFQGVLRSLCWQQEVFKASSGRFCGTGPQARIGCGGCWEVSEGSSGSLYDVVGEPLGGFEDVFPGGLAI
jgi:hypothetical protein